jgi:hypothetical protein
MSKRWLRLLPVVVLAAPLTAWSAPARDHGHDPAKPAKAAKKPASAAKPAAKAAKTPPKAAKTGPPSNPGPGMDPHGHRPPMPTPASTSRRSWDVPQAKSLAETPDVVLNSRVRAALISALSTASQDIFPETKKGVVTLTGTVPSTRQRATAEQVARKTRGVRAVKNQLRVKAARVSQR